MGFIFELLTISGNEETFGVRRITQHPQYMYESDNNDIAIMEMTSSASYGSYINRICLPQQNEILPVGTICYLSGDYFYDIATIKILCY